MTFIALARRQDLKEGAITRYRRNGLDLLLVQTEDRLHIIENRCPHDGSPLQRGAVADGCIRCPRHRILFGLADGLARGGEAVAALPALGLHVPVWRDDQVGILLD